MNISSIANMIVTASKKLSITNLNYRNRLDYFRVLLIIIFFWFMEDWRIPSAMLVVVVFYILVG